MNVQLRKIAHARSGDKGDTGNIGLLAYNEAGFRVIQKYVTIDVVKKHFEGISFGEVERFELPNLRALNFLLHQALGGGGTVSLKLDAQGKTLGAAMLRMELDITEDEFSSLGL